MHIVPSARQALHPTGPAVLVEHACDPRGPAANDSGTFERARARTSNVNDLMTTLVAQVATRVRPERVNIQLTLACRAPIVDGDPAKLAFAISGVLGAQLRELDEADGGDLRVQIHVAAGRVRISIASDEVPPLQLIRALTPFPDFGRSDPTVAHCRRLVEAHGGTIELAEHGGHIGFDVVLPTLQTSSPVRMLFPPRWAAAA